MDGGEGILIDEGWMGGEKGKCIIVHILSRN